MRGSSQGTPQQPGTPVPEYIEQDWQKASGPNLDADLEWAAAENSDEEEWECVACGKTFRSEAAWDSHERSKKHMQAVERLKRAMLEENEEFGLDADAAIDGAEGTDDEDAEEPPESSSPQDDDPETPNEIPEEDAAGTGADAKEAAEAPQKSRSKKKGKKKSRAPSPEPLPPLPRSERRAKVRHRPSTPDTPEHAGTPVIEAEVVTQVEDTNEALTTQLHPELSKREKRRAREAAKKAKEEEATSAPQVLVEPD